MKRKTPPALAPQLLLEQSFASATRLYALLTVQLFQLQSTPEGEAGAMLATLEKAINCHAKLMATTEKLHVLMSAAQPVETQALRAIPFDEGMILRFLEKRRTQLNAASPTPETAPHA